MRFLVCFSWRIHFSTSPRNLGGTDRSRSSSSSPDRAYWSNWGTHHRGRCHCDAASPLQTLSRCRVDMNQPFIWMTGRMNYSIICTYKLVKKSLWGLKNYIKLQYFNWSDLDICTDWSCCLEFIHQQLSKKQFVLVLDQTWQKHA